MSEILRVTAHGFDRESALGEAREIAELYFGPGVELTETVDSARPDTVESDQAGELITARFEIEVFFRVKTPTPDVRA
jgi:hypothetical protein